MLRLRQLTLVARRLAPVVEDLESVLGLTVAYRDPEAAAFGIENALLPVGNQFLEVVAPLRPETPAARYLDRCGAGGYMMTLQCDDQSARRRALAAMGVRIAFDHEAVGGHRFVQLHPKDTGGCILELGEAEGPGAAAPGGPWPAAGPDWQRARRLDFVTAIAGVDIQSSDPRQLATRWSAVLDRPLESESAGGFRISLDNAELRFVPSVDPRRDGIAAISLNAVAADRIREIARTRGCSDPHGGAVIGGLRISLLPAH